MKSKKILATIVAFASFMAVATSGLAAVNTTTTYNTGTDKVSVSVDVTEASKGSEVTYLVKSGENIVYIDQQTADETGAVSFDYKIAKDKIASLATSVQFGTNGENPVTGDTTLGLVEIEAKFDDGVKEYGFYTDEGCTDPVDEGSAYGANEKIYAKIELKDNYKIIEAVGLEGSLDGKVFKVIANKINVVTEQTVVTPEIQRPTEEFIGSDGDVIAEDDGIFIKNPEITVDSGASEEVLPEDAAQYVKVVKVIGQPKEVGVVYGDYRYPALAVDGVFESGKLYAVRIIVSKDEVVETLPAYIIEK